MPVMNRVSRRPFSTATTVSPSFNLLASAKASLTTASRRWSARGSLPLRRKSRFSTCGLSSGSDTMWPVAGSATPGRSSVTSTTTRASTAATPGIAATRSAIAIGARFSESNTSAIRLRS